MSVAATVGDRPCLAIVGPTATGKSSLAIELAERIGGEIVNLDSRQVYVGLDIGSAKPTPAERAALPHHLFDVVRPDESFDCARYRELALAAIVEIQARGKQVILVGGTGLYLKTLRHGLFRGPGRNDAIRARLNAAEEATAGTLHAELSRVDPEAAARLHRNDRSRLVRALEVWELTGRPLSEWQREHGFAEKDVELRVVVLAMDREKLNRRIDERCRAMLAAGLVREVESLLAAGYSRDLSAMKTIGYREVAAHLAGQCRIDEALALMQRSTRQLAKRQDTWFRSVPDVERLDVESVAPVAIANLLR